MLQVLQPHSCRNNRGLGYSAFARHYLRNHSCFLLLRVLRWFSSPGSPSFLHEKNIPAHAGMGCPIRISPAERLFAPNRSFSQLVTSFIASESLGIHHLLLITYSSLFFSFPNFLLSCLSLQYVNERYCEGLIVLPSVVVKLPSKGYANRL